MDFKNYSILLKLFIFSYFLFLSACASKKIIRDHEYQYSINAARSENFEKALDEFPKKEKNGFITTLEKNWLGFWIDQTNLDQMLKLTSSIDERKYLSITREAEYFFYQEMEDGYIPSEHEMIIMHLLTAQIFLSQSKVEQAQVELRRSNYLFLGFFNSNQSHFDDPALRIWQGALWAASGDWQEAQVDFRKAYEISKNKELLGIVNLDRPPPNIFLKFAGAGPELKWTDHNLEPQFIVEPPKNSHLTFSAEAWYQRHLERNHAARDILLKSNYMAQFLGVKASSVSQKALTYTFTTATKIIGVTAAVGVTALVLYIAANSPSSAEGLGYIVAAGYGFGSYMWKESDRIQNKANRTIEADEREQIKNLRTYRFVRFLPNSIGISLNETESHNKTIQLEKSKSKLFLIYDP